MRSAKLPPLRHLRRIREARGLKQTELARAVRCSPTLIGLLEAGYHPRTLAIVNAVAAALLTTPKDLTAQVLEVVEAGGAVFVAGSNVRGEEVV